jgi:hypothetical protein
MHEEPFADQGDGRSGIIVHAGRQEWLRLLQEGPVAGLGGEVSLELRSGDLQALGAQVGSEGRDHTRGVDLGPMPGGPEVEEIPAAPALIEGSKLGGEELVHHKGLDPANQRESTSNGR